MKNLSKRQLEASQLLPVVLVVLTLVNEDDLPSVYVRLCEIEDALLGRLFQRHHPVGGPLDVVNQFLCRGILIVCVQHAGGDISFLSSENL